MAAHDSIETAKAELRAGRLAEAERLLREIVAASPTRIDALELLGASLGAQGRHADALPWMDQAVGLAPASPTLLYNRAIALLSVGRAADAAADLERALSLKREFPAAWTALGRARAALGDAAGADQAFRQPVVADPGSPEALFNLSAFLQAVGRLEEAIAGYRKALALRPNFAMAASNCGIALQSLGRHAEAMPVLEAGARANPSSAPLLTNLGVAYYHVNRFAEAEACQRRAIELDPGLDEARINLGNVLAAQGRGDEALEQYRAVAERNPANADALSNLGLSLQERGDIDEAIDAYRKALAVRPDHPDALNNLGFLLQEDGRRGEAIAYYERALEVNPRLERARYNLGLAELAERHWTRGWDLAEARFNVVPPIAIPRAFSIPRLRAEGLSATKRLAVWSEQGVGDQLVYATMLPDLERRGVAFVVEIDRRLVPALSRAHDWSVVAPGSARAFEACDRHVPIASLGGILRPDTESFGAQPRKLLAADPARIDEMRRTLRVSGRRLVGISWRSFQPRARGQVQRRKSASLAEFLRLSQRDDIDLLDLQYGDTAQEREAFAREGGRLKRIEGLDLFNDIDGILAAIEACDLVITTSNVTAHFAGALGKETWLVYLAGVPPFHYWSSDSQGRCLWYPSVQVVTGPELRTWPAVFERVRARLA